MLGALVHELLVNLVGEDHQVVLEGDLDQRGQLVVKWYLKDPAGKNVGDLEQSNPVPLAATKGSWAGFGDIVATAASEGVLELLEKALTSARP